MATLLQKKLGLLLIILTLLTGCGLQTDLNRETQTDSDLPSATVDRVVDGDTVHIILDGEEESVRLLLVDTPETKHPNLPVQPYGEQASKFAKEKLTEGTQIQLEYDGPKRDKYDRLLAYIWIDGELFNEMLLEEGFARYAYEYDPPYTHSDQLKEAETKAKAADLNIWSEDGYVTEDGFTTVDIDETSSDVYYQNCTAVAEANASPISEGDPGYGTHLDRDGDGIGCE
ncbi:thermonuclease family protein [Paraliobacillus sp. X-1268]|uniref:thermonuclease family protein n=1 Tax=Paraliobacillus sp. X-1268 TaxID=2213193 RepID=UPI000E3C6FDE|nr:thermonuclease family protein [Paraliobacillus sp. X-1268]